MVPVEYLLRERPNMEKNAARRRPRMILSTLLLVLSVAPSLGLLGCAQSAKPVVPPAANLVYTYFGGPFSVPGSDVPRSLSTFDHSAGQIDVSSFITSSTAQVPTEIINGTFVAAPTGFLSISENFTTTSSGVISPQNPPLAGAWAVEIPGAGALANLLSVNNAANPATVTAAPAAMAENTACPDFPTQNPFLYVTVPNAAATSYTADYGTVGISTQGSAVTFYANPFLLGPLSQPASTVTGGCSNTTLGSLTAFPLNSFGTATNPELIAIGRSGLLTSSFTSSSGNGPGAFGGGTGAIGVAAPSSPVNVGAVVSALYNGFVYAPQDSAPVNYDITVLASAFGDDTANSQACSLLQSSLMANNGQGTRTVAALPSANSLYGGEFLTAKGAGDVNDPSGANGSENCDLVIDLGNQDSANNGLFPDATVFVGANYPPFGASNPWKCFGSQLTCAVSFPAAAVVGQVEGQYVIFVVASAVSNPAAQLPNNAGSPITQPVGIYLFQKSQ
jgi:hypothetical protein